MLLARASCLLAVCGASGFDHGVVQGTDDASVVGDDAPIMIDAPPVDGDPVVPPDAANCFGSFVTVCLTTLPVDDRVVATETKLDTDADCTQVVAQTTGPALCVVAARTISVTAPLHASGSRPLVLLATQTLTVGASGLVDLGSYRLESGGSVVDEVIGAGGASGATLCGSPTSGGNDNGFTAGAGGGAGGSFGGAGGSGASGVSGAGGSAGSAASASGTPSFLRGGCSGTNGGNGNNRAGGKGGAGGGAVLLVAGSAISNAGHIRAGGMGGYGGSIESGGGGGGSGGMIVLDAPAITSSGIVNANGGGGGEGGGGSDVGGGGSSALTGTGPADGGVYNINGGDGGAGSWSTSLGGTNGATNANGGGAGGGGAGVVRVYPAQTLGGTVSPPPT
jgi:hypothetical protein